jgi:hypothetical protein
MECGGSNFLVRREFCATHRPAMSEGIAAVLDRIEAQQNAEPTPDDIPLIQLADMVVRGKVKLSPPQMRMLIEMLPFVAPKLSAVGYMREADMFATRLERAIERSNGAKLIEARAVEVPPTQEEV